MSMTIGFAAALGLQLAAQGFGGLWGAAIAGVATGVLLRERGAFRVGFVAAAIAAALLLAWVAARGGDVLGFAAMIGGNFSVPSWGILAATLLLPALQAGGLAGGVARLLRR
jgi:hypothetical protein